MTQDKLLTANFIGPAGYISLEDGEALRATVSIGVAFHQTAHSLDEVLSRADTRLYEAKQAGRACAVVFNEQMHQRLTRRIELENGLHPQAQRGGQTPLLVARQSFQQHRGVDPLGRARSHRSQASGPQCARWTSSRQGVGPPAGGLQL